MINLYPHQSEALRLTEGKNKVAYYLDMGLGKTFVGAEKMRQLGGKINLIICQKSKVSDWIEHYYLNYGFDIITFNLTADLQYQLFFTGYSSLPLVGIINYDLIFRRPELLKVQFDTIMLDESSLIQNETSKRSRTILKRLKHKNCILLSGTPTGGKYEKLWSQCQLLGWDISKKAYWDTYVNYTVDSSNGFPLTRVFGYKNVNRLKRKLREYGAVFMKSDEVFNLPTQSDLNIYCQVCKEYNKFQKTSIVKYKDREYIGDTTLTKLLYSRQLCGYSKTYKFRDLVDSTDDRLIVFYNFDFELEILKEICKDRPISIINGKIKDLSAYDMHDNSITFIQYQAGAMGLNLQKANKIIYYTPPLSSELFEQSKKRIHRIGQNKTCFYYYLICINTVEEKIYSTLAMRRDYTERLFENDCTGK